MKIVLFSALVCLGVTLGSALQCYSCTARLGLRTACEKNANNRTVYSLPCNYGYTRCMTLYANNSITRACALPDVCSRLHHNYTSCSICSYNLCNGHNSGFVPTYSTTIGLTFALFVILRLSV